MYVTMKAMFFVRHDFLLWTESFRWTMHLDITICPFVHYFNVKKTKNFTFRFFMKNKFVYIHVYGTIEM